MKDTFIFEWPGRHHLHLMLPFCLALAFLLHAGLFFLFAIIYPRPQNHGPDPAQIYFITPGAPDAARLEGLLRSSDPAVFAPGRGLGLPEPVPPSRHVPQYASDRPQLDPLPGGTNPFTPRSQLAGPVPFSGKPSGNATPDRLSTPTRLVSFDALSARIPPLPEGTVFPGPGGRDPEPAEFLISLGPDGRTAHIFKQHSSGDAALDLQAAQILRSLKFAPGPAGESWGVVVFEWGSDLKPVTLP